MTNDHPILDKERKMNMAMRVLIEITFFPCAKNAVYSTLRQIRNKKYWAGRHNVANGFANSIIYT
jgi:hypothetical protein